MTLLPTTIAYYSVLTTSSWAIGSSVGGREGPTGLFMLDEVDSFPPDMGAEVLSVHLTDRVVCSKVLSSQHSLLPAFLNDGVCSTHLLLALLKGVVCNTPLLPAFLKCRVFATLPYCQHFSRVVFAALTYCQHFSRVLFATLPYCQHFSKV